MKLPEAIDFIRSGVIPDTGTWADIGAGTGTFTAALFAILTEGKVIAVDKSPHALYQLQRPSHLTYEIVEGDFTTPLQLPVVDGILMANALHYAKDHVVALANVLRHLKSGGIFLLIEYNTEKANPPWVPYPVSLNRFTEISTELGLSTPEVLGWKRSIYSDGEMYVAKVVNCELCVVNKLDCDWRTRIY